MLLLMLPGKPAFEPWNQTVRGQVDMESLYMVSYSNMPLLSLYAFQILLTASVTPTSLVSNS